MLWFFVVANIVVVGCSVTQLKLRSEAKREKNYKLADDIRNKLASLEIELKDSKDKTTFRKNSK